MAKTMTVVPFEDTQGVGKPKGKSRKRFKYKKNSKRGALNSRKNRALARRPEYTAYLELFFDGMCVYERQQVVLRTHEADWILKDDGSVDVQDKKRTVWLLSGLQPKFWENILVDRLDDLAKEWDFSFETSIWNDERLFAVNWYERYRGWKEVYGGALSRNEEEDKSTD
jgi:hypothetical protein